MSDELNWLDLPDLMEELRAMAQRLLALEGNAQSLQPTALVNSALRRQKLKGVDWNEITWKDRAYFFAAMHGAMIRALIDHARLRNAQYRQAIKPVRINELQIGDWTNLADERPEALLALERALSKLDETHPEWAEAIKHRFLSQLTLEETARMMGKSDRTIRTWTQRGLLLLREAIQSDLAE